MQKKGKKSKKGSGRGQESKKGKGKRPRSDNTEYVVNDEKIYGDFDEEPDPELRDFYYDDVDEFHEGKDEILLEQGYQHGDDDEQSDDVE